MKSKCSAYGISEAKLAEAAAWRVHLTEINADTSPEFEIWLTDRCNAAAWECVSHSWNYFGEHANEPSLIAVRRAALGNANHAHARIVVPTMGRWMRAVAAVILLTVALGWSTVEWLRRPDDYATALGERRVITLADGSMISLDVNSEVTVRYTKNSRELQLLHGQARFDVAHDVERPFSVLAGNQKVIATGTAFNVDMADRKVLVTLIEGHVVVLDEDRRLTPVAMRQTGWPASVELKAGQQLAAVPEAAPAVESANIQRVTAWTNGQIMFDNEALTSVVARVNRYASTQITIDDPKVAMMRISGVLNVGDVNGFVDIVTHYLPVRAVEKSDGAIALESQSKG